MTGASYIPGGWLGIIRSRTAVLLGPEAPAELAGALWELLAGRPEPHEVLAAVTSSSGGSLTRIPSFAILDFNGSLRVFLRGAIDLTVEQPSGAVDLDGRDVTTWNERKFVVPGTCRLGLPDGGAAGTGGAWPAEGPGLPLGEGVVLLRSLIFGTQPSPAAVDGAAADTGTAAGEGTAVITGTAPADGTEAGHVPAAPDGPFAVNAAGEVESAGEVDTASEVDGSGDAGHVAGIVVGVIDEDLDVDPVEDPVADVNDDLNEAPDGECAEDGNLPQAFAADALDPEGLDLEGLDPDATIAPGAIIDADEELLEEPANPAPVGDGPVGDGPAGPDGAETDPGDAAPAEELTSSYDHLWDRTVMRNIEDAAVREEPDADSGHVVPQQPPALPAAEPLAALGAAEDAGLEGAAAGSGPAADTDTATGAGNPAAAGPETGAAAASPRPASTGLIDSVPWRTAGAATTPAPEPSTPPALGTPPAPPVPAPVAFEGGPSGLAQSSSQAQPEAGFDPDHDGQTVMKSSLPGAGSVPAANQQAALQDAGDGPLVLARVCSQGHANPPTRAQCGACGAALLPDAVQVARPRLGRMRLSTGELLDLDQSMVIGRQPSVSRVQGGVMPRLVQVASPGGDISRSHVEVRLEGWHVMLCDLKATNGTVLVREGQPPRRLAQNEMAILLDGDIAELGDNISLRFEEIP